MRGRIVWGGVVLLTSGLVVASAMAAGHAWFSEDDFRWLSTVRAADFRLLDAWLPFDERDWWSYRPLAMHTWWWLGQGVFGFWPQGFYAVALGVHFARGVLVHLIARRLGLPIEIAALCGLLSVSRPPSVDVVFWASAFSYFAVSLSSLLAILLFARHQAGEGSRWQWLSALATAAALASQESAVTLPAVLFALSLFWDRATWLDGASPGWRPLLSSSRRALRRILPQLLLTLVYCVHRFVLIAPFPRRENYESVWGWNVARNAWRYLGWVAGGEAGVWIVLALAALSMALVFVWRRRRPELPGWLWPLLAALLVWVVSELLPFTPVRRSALRFAIAVEVPVVLLLGACLGALFRLADERRRDWLALAVLLLAVAAMPYRTFWQALETPRGVSARHVMRGLEADHPDPAHGTRFVVLYGGHGLVASAWAFHRESWTGSPMLAARWPGRALALVYRGLDESSIAADLAPDVVYYQLHIERGMEPVRRETLERFYQSALGSRAPGVSAAARARLAELRGG